MGPMGRTGHARTAAGPTLAVVAREVGVSVPTASKVDRGARDGSGPSAWLGALRGADAAYLVHPADVGAPGTAEAVGAPAETALGGGCGGWCCCRRGARTRRCPRRRRCGVRRVLGREPRDFDVVREAAADGAWKESPPGAAPGGVSRGACRRAPGRPRARLRSRCGAGRTWSGCADGT
ncbi:hypothetical protein GCM10018771_24580 [Streptomyces cellulosae]|nr:hypothetical protein GCM10018771_24580 [Streptomyces cellulosae]